MFFIPWTMFTVRCVPSTVARDTVVVDKGVCAFKEFVFLWEDIVTKQTRDLQIAMITWRKQNRWWHRKRQGEGRAGEGATTEKKPLSRKVMFEINKERATPRSQL